MLQTWHAPSPTRGRWCVRLSRAEPPCRGLLLFGRPGDYAAVENVFAEVHALTRLRIPTYCLMPNHWYLLVWPRHDGKLSESLRWITVTHTPRGQAQHKTSGTGLVYQGRYQSCPVQTDAPFLTVARYVERHAWRATLVSRAEDWRWGSLWRRMQGATTLTAWLSEWPVVPPRDGEAQVHRPQALSELEALRLSGQRGGRSARRPGCGGWRNGSTGGRRGGHELA